MWVARGAPVRWMSATSPGQVWVPSSGLTSFKLVDVTPSGDAIGTLDSGGGAARWRVDGRTEAIDLATAPG